MPACYTCVPDICLPTSLITDGPTPLLCCARVPGLVQVQEDLAQLLSKVYAQRAEVRPSFPPSPRFATLS